VPALVLRVRAALLPVLRAAIEQVPHSRVNATFKYL
jgi:hypothetical protein